MIEYSLSKPKLATAWALCCASLAFFIGMVDVLARVKTGTDVFTAYGSMLNLIPGLTVAVLGGCFAILSMGSNLVVTAPNEPRISKAIMVLIPVALGIGGTVWIRMAYPEQWILIAFAPPISVLAGSVLSALLAGVKINKASA